MDAKQEMHPDTVLHLNAYLRAAGTTVAEVASQLSRSSREQCQKHHPPPHSLSHHWPRSICRKCSHLHQRCHPRRSIIACQLCQKKKTSSLALSKSLRLAKILAKIAARLLLLASVQKLIREKKGWCKSLRESKRHCKNPCTRALSSKQRI